MVFPFALCLFVKLYLSITRILLFIIVAIACKLVNLHFLSLQMLSLAVLDVAIALDTQQQWLAFLVSKGYLNHILDSLSKDDEELQNLFNRNSNSHRIFYVFDSKMVILPSFLFFFFFFFSMSLMIISSSSFHVNSKQNNNINLIFLSIIIIFNLITFS